MTCYKEFLDESTYLFLKQKNPDTDSDEQIMKSIKVLRGLFDNYLNKMKTKKIEYEQFYNVYVYQELPYPSGTKERNWFEID